MEQVSFKVSLTEKDQESSKSQVRRFEVPQDCSTSYIYLKEKLRSLFGQELEKSGFNITWKDQDDDIVTVDSDEELLIAMHEMKGPVYKFSIMPSKVCPKNEQERPNKAGELHHGVICDGCQGQVSGFRYKCMTCFDYDLCETCESQGIHPDHNMIRIATPESACPGHFINRLNKMQNSYRGFQRSEESRNACRWPKGSGCPRDSGRGFHSRGGNKRGGCKVVPPPFCWMSNQQYCNSANSEAKNSEEFNSKRCKTDGEVMKATQEAVRADLESTNLNSKDSDSKKDSINNSESSNAMNDFNNFGEVVKATQEAVRAALESTNLNSKDSDSKKDSVNNSEPANAINDFNNFGEVMRAILSSLGAEWDVAMKNSDDRKTDSENAKDSENKENSEAIQDQEKDSETGTKLKTRTIPILEENHQTNENSSKVQGVQEESNPDLVEAMEETVMPLSPKVKVALQAMENMGFNNDNDWLSDLLMKYNGDIGKVLDLISKRN